MIEEIKINKKVFDVIDLKEKKQEYKYWLGQSPNVRIQAIELLRKINYGYDPLTERLQRFFEIAELT